MPSSGRLSAAYERLQREMKVNVPLRDHSRKQLRTRLLVSRSSSRSQRAPTVEVMAGRMAVVRGAVFMT